MAFKRSLLAASVAATLVASGAAHATNGYFSHGYGVKSMGMGGGGVALPNDSAMIIATNPAGITKTGTQINFDLSWFHPTRGYEYSNTANTPMGPMPAGNGSGNSGSNNFYIPELSASYAINDTNSIGIAVYGNGGMNTDFSGANDGNYLGFPGVPATGPYGAGAAGVNLKQLFVAPTYAHAFMNGQLSVGASVLFARQSIQVKGLGNFNGTGPVPTAINQAYAMGMSPFPFPSFSTDSANFTSNNVSHSTGWGGKIGVLYQPFDFVSLGASYQSKISMSRFNEYTGLFAEGGKFDIPSTWTIGGAFKVAPAVTLTADYQRINYKDVKAISNPSTEYLFGCMQSLMTTGMPGPTCLGGSNGAGFGWSNVNVVKLGAQWQVSPALQLRVGFNHGTNPVSSSDALFNTIAPGVVKNHYTAGFTYAIDQHQEISGALMYAPTVTVSGTNPLLSQLAKTYMGQDINQNLSIHMKQLEATVGYAYKF